MPQGEREEKTKAAKAPPEEETSENSSVEHKMGNAKNSPESENAVTTEEEQESEKEANEKTDETCRGSYNLCAQTPGRLARHL